jgi:SPOR domain
MATSALSRRKGRAASQIARARREKVALVAGFLILGALLAIEGPKTLNGLRGTSPAPAQAPTGATTAPSHAGTAPRTGSKDPLAGFAAKDPFVQQLGVNGVASPGPTRATPPAVRTSHFVQKDPFVQQLGAPASSAAAALTAAVPPKVLEPKARQPRPLATVGHGVVVIVASVPVARGQAAADNVAAQARTKGVQNVHVALSSAQSTLRSGFYAVYSGPYSTLTGALNGLKSIRGAGYTGAYTRRLGK